MKSILSFIFAAVLGAILSGCGGGGGGGNIPSIPPTSITLTAQYWISSDIRTFIRAENPNLLNALPSDNGWISASVNLDEYDAINAAYEEYLQSPHALYQALMPSEIFPIDDVRNNRDVHIELRPGNEALILSGERESVGIVLAHSENPAINNFRSHFRDIVVTSNLSAGLYTIIVLENSNTRDFVDTISRRYYGFDSSQVDISNGRITLSLALIQDGGKIYLARYCGMNGNQLP